MAKVNAAITGVQGYVPEFVLTNKLLETMVDTTDEWISTRTGIKERRILKGEDKGSSHMGAEAVKDLLEKTGTSPDEVELVICATVTPDMLFPNTANFICDMVGIKNAYSFDINAACSGFLYALTTGTQFITSGMHKKVIVVGADKMSSIVDYTDRTTCILFGDAAGAVMLEPTEEEVGILDTDLHADGSGWVYLNQKAGGSRRPATHETVDNKEHYIYQNGRPVFKAAVKGMVEAIQTVMNRNGLTPQDVNWVVPHQANMRIIESISKMMDFPMDKIMVNIHKYGNTTAATLPLCLWDYEDQLSKGDDLILTAFGGGFTWGATWVKWAI